MNISQKHIDSVLATAISHLLFLTEHAILAGTSDNLKTNHKEIGGVKWWNFYAKIIIDKKLQIISIPVLQAKKGKNEYKFQYSVDFVEIKKILARRRTLK